MKVSYLITCSTETETLQNLLETVVPVAHVNDDEVIVVVDSDVSENQQTLDIIKSCGINPLFHGLNRNYGEHKNWCNKQCSGDWIMQLDGDECPSEYLVGENLHTIIEANSGVELIFIPRINDYVGVTNEHAATWGWKLTPSPNIIHEKGIDKNSKEYQFLKSGGYIIRETHNRIIYKAVLVQWPDHQGRLYRNIPDRIKWDRRLHEKIQGHESYATLPPEEDYAMLHSKKIDQQWATNKRYNEWFSKEENMGHGVF